MISLPRVRKPKRAFTFSTVNGRLNRDTHDRRNNRLFAIKKLIIGAFRGVIFPLLPVRLDNYRGRTLFQFQRIQPGDEKAMENLARYIIRASFSQERMTYIPEESNVLYRSKDGKKENMFDALEWLAAMCSHVPNKGEQMVRYYGYYSNVSRGKRKKQNEEEWIPYILESDQSSKEYRRNWARLIQKIYEVDPLTCPKCSGKMKVISVIEDKDVIKKILKHLGLWDIKERPPPKATGPPKVPEYNIDYSVSQLPPSDKWLYVDPQYPDEFSP